MNRYIPLWATWLIFVVVFIIFGVTHLTIIGVAADIFLLIAIVESVRAFIASRKAKRPE